MDTHKHPHPITPRRLTRLLRDKGAQNGCIVAGDAIDEAAAIAAARAYPGGTYRYKVEGPELRSKANVQRSGSGPMHAATLGRALKDAGQFEQAEALLSEALRSELVDNGVGVTTVHPGGIRTRIAESALVGEKRGVSTSVSPEVR